MFFGFKPSEQTLKGVKIVKEPFNKCSNDKGKCRGQLPVKTDEVTKLMFVYLDMPENYTFQQYVDSMKTDAVYDEGIMVTKYTAVVKGDTYCWIE